MGLQTYLPYSTAAVRQAPPIMKIRVAIVGATGYSGGELVRLLLGHESVEITSLLRLTSDQPLPLYRAHPSLRGLTDLECVPYDESLVTTNADVCFLAAPNGKASELTPNILAAGLKVVDISADFRFRNADVYSEWYGVEHPSPELLSEAVYGLPELKRDQIKSARLVANSGCYPMAALLALIPLIAEKLINVKTIVVDAKSGVSGAGRSRLEQDYLFTEISGDFRAYSVASHRHTPEIEQELSSLYGASITLTFTPHLLPISRGIFCTTYAELIESVSTADLQALYAGSYAEEPFVRVLDQGELPKVKAVVGSNFCDVSVVVDERTGRVIVLSAIDNLGKGAAGNAIHNMNLMFGLDETLGLCLSGSMP